MKKNHTTLVTTALVTALLSATSVSYARGGLLFSEMDTDSNGAVTEQEFDTAKAKRMESRAAEGRPMRGLGGALSFIEIDQNSDNEITAEELISAQQAKRQQRGKGKGSGKQGNKPVFEDYDADDNGSVSEQEFNDARAKRIAARAAEGHQMRNLSNAPTFASADTNHDHSLTADEFQVMKQACEKHGKGEKKARGGMGKGRPPQPVFTDFDSNNDKMISEQELYAGRNKRIAERVKEGRKMRGLATMPTFADIDTNKDGSISEDEFIAQRQKHKSHSDSRKQ